MHSSYKPESTCHSHPYIQRFVSVLHCMVSTNCRVPSGSAVHARRALGAFEDALKIIQADADERESDDPPEGF
eukprot:2768291-Pleurochrysis_carterae.AAC.3